VPARDYYDRFSQLSDHDARSLLLGSRLARVFDEQGDWPNWASNYNDFIPVRRNTSNTCRSNDERRASRSSSSASPEPGDFCAWPAKTGLVSSRGGRKLNLTVSSLNHLETGAFDKLPGHTFARGYIRAYAKLMGMDQAPW
jgi:hypothetical protein